MTERRGQNRLSELLREEWQQLTAVNPHPRRWPMPIAAALATGLPLLLAAWLGEMRPGLIAALGGMVFLHLPETPLHHRMLRIMACAFVITACYALGLGIHALQLPALNAPLLGLVSLLITIPVRYFRLPPPGPLFFILAAAVGTYSQVPLIDLPWAVGWMFLGAFGAVLIAFLYSVITLWWWPSQQPVPGHAPWDFEFVVVDSIIVAVSVTLAMAVAEALQMPRPYWVAVSCLAVVQGISLRAVWNRQVQRIIGTLIGVGLASVLLQLPLNPWRLAWLVIILTVIVETIVVRQYAVAAIFTTPLTILLADAGTLGSGTVTVQQLINARFLDTVLGSVFGLLGGYALHTPSVRRRIHQCVRFRAGSRTDAQ